MWNDTNNRLLIKLCSGSGCSGNLEGCKSTGVYAMGSHPVAVYGRERKDGSYFTTEMEPRIFVARPGVTSRCSIKCTYLLEQPCTYLGRRNDCHHQTVSEIDVSILLLSMPLYTLEHLKMKK